jgi:hypothetical protein
MHGLYARVPLPAAPVGVALSPPREGLEVVRGLWPLRLLLLLLLRLLVRGAERAGVRGAQPLQARVARAETEGGAGGPMRRGERRGGGGEARCMGMRAVGSSKAQCSNASAARRQARVSLDHEWLTPCQHAIGLSTCSYHQ